jgi:NAD(P)-binding Rossmann-like domain
MGKSDVAKISRKSFLELSSLAIAGTVLGLESCQSSAIQGQIVGANHAIGHLVRKAISLPIAHKLQTKVLIIGSGISGLTAGYYLQKAGITDYEILELEAYIGGNAAFGEDAAGRYPWAAHYLPIPSLENRVLVDFLAEHNIIKGFDDNGLPFYDEYALCFDSEERLFIKGFWQEGLIPKVGITTDDEGQIAKFLAMMNDFKKAKGQDQRWAFAIPLAESSQDATFTDLDKISMADWLQRYGFVAAPLIWYVSYCLLDDYGTVLSDTSAWAGIHYFASRRGNAANAKDTDVLTWSEGNGYLMKILAKNQTKQIKTQQLAYHVAETKNGVLVDVYDWKTQQRTQYEAEQLIWAIPQLLRPYLMPQFNTDFIDKFDYTPWLVANLQTTPFDTGRGQALAWDNVIYEADGLGYIMANHQNLNANQKVWQLTYYKPLVAQIPAKERLKAIKKNHAEWVVEVLQDLKKAHPKIENFVQKIDIKLWGHAMIRPTVGFIYGSQRQAASKSINNKIHFAHADISGISIFEEAFYQGHQAASKATNLL